MIKALGERVVIRPDAAEEVTSGGILIPAAAQEKPTTGEVVSVGSEVSVSVAAGDKVMFSKYHSTEVQADGEDLLVVKQDDLILVMAEG